MTRGIGSWIAISLGCTTTGAVAVRPLEPVTCTVPWPGASATTTPFWSTLAMSGRSDFHVTVTGAAGEPSSLSARGNTRVFSDGSRYTVGGSIRSTAAGPEPTTCPANGSTPEVAGGRSEEHTSELQSRSDLVCRLLLEKKKRQNR